jgi:hypothetical protein
MVKGVPSTRWDSFFYWFSVFGFRFSVFGKDKRASSKCRRRLQPALDPRRARLTRHERLKIFPLPWWEGVRGRGNCNHPHPEPSPIKGEGIEGLESINNIYRKLKTASNSFHPGGRRPCPASRQITGGRRTPYDKIQE